MTARRFFNECLIKPSDIEPSRPDFEVVGTFNPGAVELDGEVVLVVRVAERPAEQSPGQSPLPRWDPEEGLTVDWVPDSELEKIDPRVVLLRKYRRLRMTTTSHLRVFRIPEGRALGPEIGRFMPQEHWESFGAEDPRIVRIGGKCYFTYVGVSEHGALTALASTEDFETFQRHGIIFCPENKDVVLFPRKIDGSYVALHRPNPRMHFSSPGMWLARSVDALAWGNHVPLHAGEAAWEVGRIGAGCPPLEMEQAWLEIYHGKTFSAVEGEVGTYSAGVLLLDKDDPSMIVSRSTEPIFVPEAPFEKEGFVPSVVFPTGIVRRDDTVLVYYGAADTCTGVVEFSLEELLESA